MTLKSNLFMPETRLQKSRIALCVASMCLAGTTQAQPSGAEVVHGSASFNQQSTQMDIRNSNGAIINWQDFSIAQNESVRFLQESVSSSVLNRVVSGIPSEILGSLSSNGRVFLINPNGLVIGEGSRINTAAFIASTLNISDQDFIDGKLKFSGDSGKIENHGYIAAGPQGEVVLIAPSIENHGLIKAEDGSILLAAGREVVLHSLTKGGISYKVSAPDDTVLNVGELVASNGSVKVFADQIFQQGQISANRAYRAADGSIVLEADSNIHVSGSISVSGEGVDAGSIQILGDQIDIESANIDASGESGGEILIGGDYQGKGSVKNALNANLDEQTIITANAGQNGNGGRVIIWSDDTTNSYAKITAKGGSQSGDGGFVETSGKKVLDFGQAVDVSATNGAAGTWLLDPEDIVIDEEHAESISTSLNGGSNVEVRTSDEGDGEGNITVAAPITKTEGDAAVTLTLDAHNRVDVNAPITTTAGPLNLTIKTGRQVVGIDEPEETTPDEPSSEESPDEVVENENDEAIEEETIAEVDGEADGEAEEEVDSESNEESSDESLADEAIENDDELDLVEADEEEVAEQSSDALENSDTQSETDSIDESVAEVDQAEESPESSGESSVAIDSSSEAPTTSTDSQSEEVTEVSELEADVEGEEVIADEPDDIELVSVETVNEQSQAANFIDQSQQQIVIASDIFTGGGSVSVNAGQSGDTIVAADIVSSETSGDTAGDIVIEGARIAVVDEAVIDASADEAGEILIGGGQQGQDEEVDNSQVVFLAEGTSVNADGGEEGDGGRVIVFSEQNSTISANLSARGGTQSGNGGFIETSGLANLSVSGTPNAGANNGDGGTWLIDPINITISDAPTVNADGATDYGIGSAAWNNVLPTNTGANLQASQLVYALGLGDVVISTTNDGFAEDGNINIDAQLSNSTTLVLTGGLTLNADGDINVNRSIDFVNGYDADTVDLTFNAGGDITIQGLGEPPLITADPAPRFILTRGDITFNAGENVVNNANVTGSTIDVDAVGNVTTYASPMTAGQLISTGGGIDISAGGNITTNAAVTSDEGIIFTAVGDVTTNSAPASNANGRLTSTYGDIEINAGGNITTNDRVRSSSNLSFEADGDVTVNRLIQTYDGGVTLSADNNVTVHSTIRTDVDNPSDREYYSTITLTADADRDNSGTVTIDSSRSSYIGIGGNNTSEITIAGAQVDIESFGCSGADCSSSVSLVADDINIGTQASQITGNINIRASADIADQSIYSGGYVRIESSESLNIYSLGTVTVEAAATQQYVDGRGIINHQQFSYGTLYDNQFFSNTVDIESYGGVQNITAQVLDIVTNAGDLSRVTLRSVEGDSDLADIAQNITVEQLSIDTFGSIQFDEDGSQADIGGNASISSRGAQTINVGQNAALFGHEVIPVSVGSPLRLANDRFSSAITSYNQQTIDINGQLTMVGGEITTRTYNESIFGPPTPADPVNLASSITTADLVVVDGLIAQQRDSSVDSSTLSLTTEDTVEVGARFADGSEFAFAQLRLESVNWQQDAELEWISGAIEVVAGAVEFSNGVRTGVDSTINISNGALFTANSETGSLSFLNADASVGTIVNAGTIEKRLGTSNSSSTSLFANVNNTGNIRSYIGTLDFGDDQTVTQSSGETLLIGGNIAAGEFNFTGGSLRGGFGDYDYSSGGTLASDVTIQGTSVTPGFSPGTLTIDGDFDASGGGNTFNLEVYADGAYDSIFITGNATIPYADITGTQLNQVVAQATGYFSDSNDPNFGRSYVVIQSNTGTIANLQSDHSADDPNVIPSEFVDGGGDFNLVYDPIPDEEPEPPVVVVVPPTEEPPVIEPPVVDPPVVEQPETQPEVVVTPPQPEPPTPEPPLPEPEVIVVIIDEQPLALPPEIVDVIVSLSEDERVAYLESERVKRYIKTVNMCVGKA